MTSRTLTPANQITLLRLVFVPVFAILVIDGHYRLGLLVLILAAISDVIDGTVARLLKQESALGVALDPIADKILLTTAYLVLAFRAALPWWLTILVISRDVAIIMTALVISIVAGYRPFRPTVLGKASTAAQVITVFTALSHVAGVPFVSETLTHAFIYMAAALTVTSGIHYAIVVQHHYTPSSSEEASEEPGTRKPMTK